MFTGLIESLGRVVDVSDAPAGKRLLIKPETTSDLTLGESVAVNGVCLTVVECGEQGIAFDVSPETLSVTTLAGLRPASLVNMERSMRADARLGGHFVQGHVDGVGTVESLVQEGESYRLTIAVPPSLMPLIVSKGSVAVDGVSLTVASLDDLRARFDVQIVPFTWLHTRFHVARSGEAVNVECDILGKYVARALERQALAPQPTRGRS